MAHASVCWLLLLLWFVCLSLAYIHHIHPQNRNMVTQLIEHDRLVTTIGRAKELRKLADRMVTLAKEVCVVVHVWWCVYGGACVVVRVWLDVNTVPQNPYTTTHHPPITKITGYCHSTAQGR